jgi:hypothetical protein
VTFPDHEWALAFLVQNPLWRQANRPAGQDPRAILKMAREQLRAISLESLTIPWNATYHLWHRERSRG